MGLTELANQQLTFRKKVFKLAGKEISAFDQSGNLGLYIKQKAFKLKEDIRAYSDKSMSDELLYIQARKILDVSAAYDVIDSKKEEKVGTLKRKGMASFIRDQWEVYDESEQLIGKIMEDSTAKALIRRFLTNLIPQSYDFTINDSKAAVLKQHFNPFVFKADLKIEPAEAADHRLILAGAILLMCIEGRQG